MKKMLKSKKGFTLVELMVVVAILGILVAVAIPVYNNVTANSQVNVCHTNSRAIDSAVMTYNIDHTPLTNGATAQALTTALVPSYLRSWPTCPVATGNVYSLNANGRAACNQHGDATNAGATNP